MADEPSTVAFERGDHGVDVLRAGEQEQGRGLGGNLGADLVQERVVQVRRVIGLAHPARDAAGDEPDRQPGRTEQDADHGTGQGALAGSLADHVPALVDVDVAARERAPHHDAIVPVVLDERDLVDPRLRSGGLQHARVGPLGTLDVMEDQKCEIEAHARTVPDAVRAHLLRTG